MSSKEERDICSRDESPNARWRRIAISERSMGSFGRYFPEIGVSVRPLAPMASTKGVYQRPISTSA